MKSIVIMFTMADQKLLKTSFLTSKLAFGSLSCALTHLQHVLLTSGALPDRCDKAQLTQTMPSFKADRRVVWRARALSH